MLTVQPRISRFRPATSKCARCKTVENYVKTLKEFKNKNFKIYNINNIPKDEKMLWVICYEPLVGFDCTLPNNKENEWNLVTTKKNHLLNSRLFKINN